MDKPTVLLTGGCGFIGRCVVPHLIDRGYRVHILTRSGSNPLCSYFSDKYQGLVSCYQVDLLNSAAIPPLVKSLRASHLLHLAWDTRHGIFWNSLENHQWVTCSEILVESFIEAGGVRVVTAGTGAEYDWTLGYERLDEATSKLNPATLYGESKLKLRGIIAELSKQNGLSAAWGRIFFLYGPFEGPQRLVSSAIISLLKGDEFKASKGDQIRDFAFVDEIAQAFAALLDSSVTGDINIASGEPRTVASVLEMIGELTRRPELIKLGARPKAENDPDRIVADVTRLNKELGISFNRSLQESLSSTLDWWRSEIFGGDPARVSF